MVDDRAQGCDPGRVSADAYEHWKRVADVTFGALLLVSLAPLMVTIAFAVRLTSTGPVLFRQLRVGRGGRLFRICKFRTMRVDADRSGPLITSSADGRVTPLGRILRRTKLDELPQLLNVIAGDMSFVGPRPQVERFAARFPMAYRQAILSMRPGITGPTQLLFRHEEEMLQGVDDPEEYYIRELLPSKCRTDADYVQQRSLRRDAAIALETAVVFVRGNSKRVGRRITRVVAPEPTVESEEQA